MVLTRATRLTKSFPEFKPMSAREFRAAIDKLEFQMSEAHNDLGFSGFARFAGYAPRSVRQWAAETAPIPQGVAVLLRLMVRLKLTADKAARLLEA